LVLGLSILLSPCLLAYQWSPNTAMGNSPLTAARSGPKMFHHAKKITINGGKFTNIQQNYVTNTQPERTLEDDERSKIMDWVSPINVSVKQHDVSSVRHPGTGEWFLGSYDFKTWEIGTGQALWCVGVPGAGKTSANGVYGSCMVLL